MCRWTSSASSCEACCALGKRHVSGGIVWIKILAIPAEWKPYLTRKPRVCITHGEAFREVAVLAHVTAGFPSVTDVTIAVGPRVVILGA